MIHQRRHPPARNAPDRSQRDRPLDGQFMGLEEFWDFLADEAEAMGEEELRVELDSLRIQRAWDVH